MLKTARLKNSEICTFLEILENYSIIWNIKLKDYSNKLIRNGQIAMMLRDLEKKNLYMNEDDFRTRLKSIKDTYRKELKKVNNSKKSGTDPKSLYSPKLTWYDQADAFLREVTSTRNSSSNIQDENRSDPAEENEESFEEFKISDDNEFTQCLEKPRNRRNKSNIIDKTADNIIQEQKGDDENYQKRPNISNTLEKINKDKQIIKNLKRKQPTSPTYGSNVQNAIEHLDNIVSKIQKTENENDRFAQYVASQLNSLPSLWSVMLRGEIKNAITKTVFDYLFRSQNSTFSSPYHPSRDVTSSVSSISSHDFNLPTPHMNKLNASSNPSPSSYSTSSPSLSSYPPFSLLSYPSFSPSLHPPSTPTLHPPPSVTTHLSHSSHTVLPNQSPSNLITNQNEANIEENDSIIIKTLE